MNNQLIQKLTYMIHNAKKECKSAEVVELDLALKQATSMVHALKGVIADVEHCETCMCGLWDEDPETGAILDKMKKESIKALNNHT